MREDDTQLLADHLVLAGFQDLKHERQALGDELLRVLLLLDGLELLEQALDERPAVLLEGDPQGLQPRVQCPGHAYASDVNGDIHVAVLGAVVHGLPQGPQLGLAVAAGTQGGRGSVCQVSALGQNLLQGQDVALLLLWLSQQFAEHIPVSVGCSLAERVHVPLRGGRSHSCTWFLSGGLHHAPAAS